MRGIPEVITHWPLLMSTQLIGKLIYFLEKYQMCEAFHICQPESPGTELYASIRLWTELQIPFDNVLDLSFLRLFV